MSKHYPSTVGGFAAAHPTIGADEQAVIEKVRSRALRDLFVAVWRFKLRLQFTGWLQYIPFAIFSLVSFLAAGLAILMGYPGTAIPFFIFGILVSAITVFDLTTVKFRIRPDERLPRRNDDLGVFDLMRTRRSCRSFQTRKLTEADRIELLASVRRRSEEPTIGTAPIRFEYISAPLTVWPVVNASEFLVAIAPSEYDRLAVIDVGHSLQKIVIDATRMGLGTCWIGPGADHASIRQYLGDRFNPEEDHIVCVCAVGYKSWFIPMFLRIFNAQFRRRLPLSALFFADVQLEQPLDVEAQPFNRFGRSYEVCQWAPSSYNGQTTRCAAVMGRKSSDEESEPCLERFDFYAAAGSRYYAPVALGIWCANWEMGCRALGISGHLAVLPENEQGVRAEGNNQTFRYDASWVLEGDL